MGSKIQKESQFRQKICRDWRAAGAVVLPMIGNAGGYAGTPDVYLSHRLFQGFIEFKGEKTKLQIIQQQVMQKLIETGTECFIVRAPCSLQDQTGTHLADFNDAFDLLKLLRRSSLGIS